MPIAEILDLPGADHEALVAACAPGVSLCTIVGIEGGFSRRRGAQLAVLPSGETVGSLADGCLESQLARDVREQVGPKVVRYGKGSSKIDFKLPCGGGIDILLDPAPDRSAVRRAMRRLEDRKVARLALPVPTPLAERTYLPNLRLRVFGEGPEINMVGRIATSAGVETEVISKDALSLGRASKLPPADAWTAILLLFHDHEWETALIEEALSSDAFYIGAQGGENARMARMADLMGRGIDERDLTRLRSPVGVVAGCRTPQSLALSALAEIVVRYEELHDRH